MPKQVSLTYLPSKGAQMPFTATAQTAPTNVFGNVNWQIGGVYSGVIPVLFPPFSGGRYARAFNVSLPFAAFTLPKGGQACVSASVSLAAPPGANPILSIPVLQLTVQGSGVQAATGGVAQFTLKPGRSYKGFSLTGSLLAYTPTSVPQEYVYLTVQAMLLGLPPSN